MAKAFFHEMMPQLQLLFERDFPLETGFFVNASARLGEAASLSLGEMFLAW